MPIVTTRVGGVEELLSAGVTGYVCDPWNPSTFADYLQLLVDHPERRAAMSLAARERASDYPAAKMINSTVEFYNRLRAREDLEQASQATHGALPTNSK